MLKSLGLNQNIKLPLNYKKPDKLKDTNFLTIRVPVEVIAYVAKRNETFLIGITVWVILKHTTSAGRIRNYRRQLQTIAATYRIRVRTITKYLVWLTEHDLIHIDNKDLVLQSYKNAFGITCNKKETIVFDTTGSQSLVDLIYTTVKNHPF